MSANQAHKLCCFKYHCLSYSIIPLHVICMQMCPSRIMDNRNILYTPPHIRKEYN